MNRSNFHSPAIPPNCCCTCNKKDYSSKGGRGAKYAESSPDEDDEDEDECGNHTFKNNDKSFVRDEVYENLIDLIDDQMMSTMSALRKKARKFMKTELEQSFSSDTNSRPCTCPEDIRNKGVNVVKKVNEINYQPQSTFLKKMVQQYQCKQSDYSELDESDSPAMIKKPIKPKNKQQNNSKAKSPPTVNQNEKLLNSCCCKCPKDDSLGLEEECSQKKSEHVSRSKKKIKCRGKRKRKSDGKCESKDLFEGNLKQPHENSCERCWRFASPSRSPVNKPDQRYDPNFRRGHSSISLDPKKIDDVTDVKENQTSCKNQQSNLVTFNVTKNVPPTSTPQASALNKVVPIQNAPCEDYSARYTPFSEPKKMPCRSQTYDQSNPYIQLNELDFEYPSPRYPEASPTQQTCTPRPHSCEKIKRKESLEKGIIYSSKVRNLLERPQSAIPAPCNYNKEDEYTSSLPYKEVCGRGRPENLDPCMRRSLLAKKKSPCEDMDMSVLRGDTSRGSGLGSGLDTSRLSGLRASKGSGLGGSKVSGLSASKGSGLDMDGDDFDKSGQSDSAQERKRVKDASKKKGANSSTSKKSKPSDGKKKNPKSPKAKSPPKTPKESPRGSKIKKGSDSKKGTCATNEAQAYFKIPGKPKAPETCGLSHPIRNCTCYPKVKDDSDPNIYCCHCNWQQCQNNEAIKVNYDQAGSTRRNSCCSPPPFLSETSKSQGRRLSPVLNRTPNQKSALPDIDEYPEQLFDISMNKGYCPEVVLPCPYREYMNDKSLNNPINGNGSVYKRSNASTRYENLCSRNENTSNANENPCSANPNFFYRTEKANVPHMLHEDTPRYCNGNMSFGNYPMAPNMNAGYEMDYPRKYCVMYMTKGKECAGDDVEVLVEELTQNCPYEKDSRMVNVSEKMTRMFKCPTESMALRFQKGVSDRNKAFQKSRFVYF